MHGRTRVLIIDDEYKTLELLGMRLNQDGFEVTTATTGEAGLKLAYETHPDAILLDIMMPGMDGFKACRRLREVSDAVIILVTVKGDSDDVIRGLHSGADDYIVKPYNYLELLARLYACLRRRADSKLPPLRLQRGEAVLITDPSRRLVFINDGRSVQLTPKEFELLRYLVQNRGRVLGADAILTNVWGPEYKGERDLVKQFIYRLRNKLEPNPSKPEYIKTVRGSGYAFEEDTRPRKRRKANQAPGRKTESSPQLQTVKPLIAPEGQEAPTWATQAHPMGSVSRSLYRGESEAPSRTRKKIQTWARRTIATLFLTVLVSLGTAFVSGYALPGDVLYPVKTLVEGLQNALTLNEISRAQLHLAFAETRLEEATALLTQDQYGDIPTVMAEFEHEMRQANLQLIGIARDEDGHGWATATLLGKGLESHAEVLDNLMSNAPHEARPAIVHAIGVLTSESTTLRALLIEISPPTTMDEMVEGAPSDVRADSRVDEPVLRTTPEFPGFSGAESGLQAGADEVVASIPSYPWDSDGFLSPPPVVPTRLSFPPSISTPNAIPTQIATTRPASTRNPRTRHYSLPQH